MWRWWCLGLIGCVSSPTTQQPPRERDVLIEAFPGGVIVYQDGDGPWALAPRVGDRYGFDVSGDRFAVALIDVERRRVDSVYATVTERPDIAWHAVGSQPDHVVTGTIDGLNNGGGLIAGRLRSQRLGQPSSQTFAMNAMEGPQAIVFARNAPRSSPAANFALRIDSLIVRRDVNIAGDVTQDADFAVEGQPTVITPVSFEHLPVEDCNVLSTFSFGDTALELARPSLKILSPSADQWRGGDQLAIEVSCETLGPAVTGFPTRIAARNAAVPDVIPTDFELPPPLGFGDLKLMDGRLVFSWEPYPAPVLLYQLKARAPACLEGCGLPEWSSDVTEGWAATQDKLEPISRSDLEALGLWDPALDLLVDTIIWSVTAVSSEGDTSSSARWFGGLVP